MESKGVFNFLVPQFNFSLKRLNTPVLKDKLIFSEISLVQKYRFFGLAVGNLWDDSTLPYGLRSLEVLHLRKLT